MSRRARAGLGVLVALLAVLILNATAVDRETKPARATAPEGELVRLDGGTLQVVDEPATGPVASRGAPIVLVHCFTCSLRWWDRIVPELREQHRVVRVDLLGHGGSEKPRSGYEISNQASLVAQVMGRLGLQGAVVVGHSLGGGVATAIAESSSELVDRVVIIDSPPDEDARAGFSLTAKLASWPLIGQATWRFAPDFLRRGQLEDNAFGDGFDTDQGFDDPDQPLEDLKAMTYSSFDASPEGFDQFIEERPLSDRITAAAVPALAIYGADDDLVHVDAARAEWASAPGARVTVIPGIGHSPNVEAPERTAELILAFARGAAASVTDGRRSRPPRPGKPGARKRNDGSAGERPGRARSRRGR